MTELWRDFGIWAGGHPQALVALVAAIPVVILVAFAWTERRRSAAAAPARAETSAVDPTPEGAATGASRST